MAISKIDATSTGQTGTVMASGNMPAFSAYQTTGMAVSNATWTKILFDIKQFDTNNNFASSRFTPTVAGYYQVNGTMSMGITSNTVWALCGVYKNGAIYSYGTYALGTGNGLLTSTSTLVYCNGSTDYIELYVYQNSGSTNSTNSGLPNTQFSASMVRAA